MLPPLDITEPQWLAQLTTMRDTVAQLKLDQPDLVNQQYGADIEIEDCLTSEDSEDVWNTFDDDDDDDKNYDESDISSDTEQVWPQTSDLTPRYDLQWLAKACQALAATPAGGLNANQLLEQVISVLISDMNGISSPYFDGKGRMLISFIHR